MKIERLLILVLLSYLGIFFLYPLIAILHKSLYGDGAYNLGQFISLIGDPYYLGRIWFTTWQALVSTLFTLIIGLPAAFLFAKYEFPGKTLLKAATTLPFVMPTIVVAMGFLALFGHNGLFNTFLMNIFDLDYTPINIVNSLTVIFMAHAFYNYSIVVRIVSSLWANLDPSLEETAKMLGASSLKVFYHVTLPLLLPAIVSSALLCFAFCFTSFGVVLILGGAEFATLEVSIYELTAKLFRLPMAGALSVIQLAFTYIFLLLYARIQETSSIPINFKPRELTTRKNITVQDRLFIFGSVLIILSITSPLISLAIRTIFFEGVDSVAQISNLFSNERGSYFDLSPLKIVFNSLRFALCSVFISLALGTIASYSITKSSKRTKSVRDALFMLPLGVSAVTLGFGYIISLSNPPIDIRGSWVILVVAHSLVAYPFVIRSLLPVLQGISPNLRAAAMILGADPKRVLISIDLPLITPALIVGATFAFAVSMGEFGASLILVRPEFTTIPVAIFRYLGLPGAENLWNALAMSSLLMIVVAIGFIGIERFRYKDLGSF